MSNAKFDIEKFDGTNNFSMWQCEVLDLLFRQGLEVLCHEGDYGIKSLEKARRQVYDEKHVEIIDEDKALLLLNSLPDTYEHLTTALLYGKDEVKFIDVSNALVNNEYRKKDQLDHRDSTSEELTVARGRTNNRRSGVPSERGRSRSKSRGPSHSKPKRESSFRRPAKDECAYCPQKGHWKKDCPNKDKSNMNVASNADNEEDSAFTVVDGRWKLSQFVNNLHLGENPPINAASITLLVPIF
ncbi:hypothetical protein EZV62_004156 [Acer yangbiense]|uniref:CCHC-type domain-containing protein n=1 Tax=Acer yangbiense TaxID=1000413 RepID=A0A5C7IJ95_9ROSI|nr:hypothetical protein EZV62_004156 [Acer yangbiense]